MIETAYRIEPEPEASAALAPSSWSDRKRQIHQHSEALAPERQKWIDRNAYYYEADLAYMRFLVPEGVRVLELGCGNGQLLAGLNPAYGVGVDFSNRNISIAESRYPHLQFHLADIEDGVSLSEAVDGPFDYIILSDTIGSLDDCQAALEGLHQFCHDRTRLIIAYYAYFWEPALKLAERLRMKMPQEPQNALGTADIANFMKLAGFEPINREWRQLLPLKALGLGPLVNRYVAPLPGLRRLSLRNYVVGRSMRRIRQVPKSASVIIPCRNERGNIESAVKRLPAFCPDLELIFIEGHSQDGTYEEIERVAKAYPERKIRYARQEGKGKADATYKGFEMASGEILLILDADLTMPPEQIPKFYEVICRHQGEFVNGSRLVYPMERQAMRFLNLIANQIFSWLFSWLLNQRYTDTLCGTKALHRDDWERLKAGKSYFGDFDPFGDFDLIFGAARQQLKMVEVPIRYRSRVYGETQISRFAHGWLLLKMVVVGYRKLKAI
ncbi:MAG: glycosyltransferase [Geminicoccaceae bacterium]